MHTLMSPPAERREGQPAADLKASLLHTVVWIRVSTRGSCGKGLVPRVLLGDGATRKWCGLMGHWGMPLKETMGP